MSTFGLVTTAIAGDLEPRLRMSHLPDDTLRVGILPTELAVDPGDSFLIEITILEAGPQFNAYDALVGYDPTRLTFLQMSPLSDQEGPLMTEACPNRFHIFSISPDSTVLTVNHSLLCAGVTVNGPGVVYRLRFQCKEQTGPTELRLLEGTVFYDDGFYVTPMLSSDAQIVIGEITTVPEGTPSNCLPLRAAPNPFNPLTIFTFELPAEQWATLRVFAVNGRLVSTVVDGVLSDGLHKYSWDGRDRHGSPMPSGGYIALLETGGRTETYSMTLIR